MPHSIMGSKTDPLYEGGVSGYEDPQQDDDFERELDTPGRALNTESRIEAIE